VTARHLSTLVRARGTLFVALCLVGALLLGWGRRAGQPSAGLEQAAVAADKPAKKKSKKGKKAKAPAAPAAVESAEPVGAVTEQHLLTAGNNNSNWLMYGRTYNAQR